jgi:hypothetical protein
MGHRPNSETVLEGVARSRRATTIYDPFGRRDFFQNLAFVFARADYFKSFHTVSEFTNEIKNERQLQ